MARDQALHGCRKPGNHAQIARRWHGFKRRHAAVKII